MKIRRLTRKRLQQIIQEEATALSERKLPPREDPEIVAQWEQVKPNLEQLADSFRESPTGPHITIAKDIELFKKRVDAGMRFVSYGELGKRGQASDYQGASSTRLPQIQERWQDMSPEADQAYKDIIKVIQDKSKNLNDDDSYNFLVALKDWTNKNVM